MMLQGERGLNASALAARLGMSQRNVHRDLKVLTSAGVPWFFDEDAGGYAIRRGYFMQPVELTFEESLALVVLCEKVGGERQLPMMKAAGRAVAKIRGGLPAALLEPLSQIDKHLAIHLSRSSPEDSHEDAYDKVSRAIQTRRVLRCVYDSPRSEAEARALAGTNGAAVGGAKRKSSKAVVGSPSGVFDLQPYCLFFSHRAWYVAGLHSKHGVVRNLKLARFSRLEPTDKPYAIPDDFSMKKHLGNAWRMMRGSPSFDVLLRFDATFADTISDTHWHPTQDTQFGPDGSMEFRCTVDGLDEIVWWVLSMGPHCEVIEPAELRERICTLATRMAATHSAPR